MISYTIKESESQTRSILDERKLLCGVCGVNAQKTNMTAGPYSAFGELTFICNTHFCNSRQLINLLADYIVNERQRYIERENFNTTSEATPDAWFLY